MQHPALGGSFATVAVVIGGGHSLAVVIGGGGRSLAVVNGGHPTILEYVKPSSGKIWNFLNLLLIKSVF